MHINDFARLKSAGKNFSNFNFDKQFFRLYATEKVLKLLYIGVYAFITSLLEWQLKRKNMTNMVYYEQPCKSFYYFLSTLSA